MKTTLLLLFISIIGFSQTTLIPLGSSWKYLSQGSAAPTNWNTSSFSDAAWPTGNAQLGFGDGDEATVTPQVVSGSTVVTTYFRKTISIATPSNCTVSMVIDDGSVVYVNGVEVNRFNLPTGTILYSTLTPTFTENAPVTFTVPASAFVSGTNIIAVEVHQNALTSSDVSFDFKLVGDVVPCSSSTVTINAGICTGSSYNFGGVNYTTAGTYSNVVSKGGEKKLNVPFGVIRWDAWYDSYLLPSSSSTYGDLSGALRSGLSLPQFKDRAPFFANPVPYNLKPMAYWNSSISSWVVDYRANRLQWNANNQAIYDQEIAYAIHAGIDFFATLWYADNANLSYGRKLFASSTNKGSLKQAYIIENLGGTYTTSINQIVADFSQPWYLKIGGKPLILISDNGYSGHPTLLADIIAAYGSPVYSAYQPTNTDGPTSWPTILSKGFTAGNWYTTSAGPNHSDIMNEELRRDRSFLPYSCDVIPLLTTSLDIQARRYSPPFGPVDPGMYGSYTPKATDSENERQIDSLISFCNSHPTKVKCAMAYAWNEYDEGGRVLCPTRDTTTGLPNTHMIDLFRNKFYNPSCDSTTILNLTVTSPPTAIANIVSSNIVANPVLGATYQWINCATSSTILGATSSTYTPTVNGSYAVIVNLNGCKVTSSCVNYNVLSDFESLNNVLSETLFYPNPTDNVFNVKFPTLVSNMNYSIKNILGQTIKEGVFSNEINTIDVSSFTNGTYFISIESGRLMVRFNVNK